MGLCSWVVKEDRAVLGVVGNGQGVNDRRGGCSMHVVMGGEK
jgi:hypothetical protein